MPVGASSATRAPDQAQDVIPYQAAAAPSPLERKLSEHKNEVLGAIRFIASLSCVDGFVLLVQREIAIDPGGFAAGALRKLFRAG